NLKAANEAVNKLFGDSGHTKLGEGITATDINQAKALANKVSNAGKKKELLDEIEKAQKLLDAVEANNLKAANEAVKKLFGDNAHTMLAEGITATDINQAKVLANKVSNAGKKWDLLDEIENAQNLLNANEAVKKLFGDNAHTMLAEGITTTDINQAKVLANKVRSTGKKRELLDEIEKAQKLLDAKVVEANNLKAANEAANKLFGDNAHTTLAEGITATDINQAKVLANKVSDADKKRELLDEIEKAQQLLNAKTAEKAAKTAVDGLFVNNDPSKDIKATNTQGDINAAQALVNKVTDATVKAELQKEINKAQSQLNVSASITATAAKYTTGDMYITGTFTGPVTALSLDVNGKRYYGGDIYASNGTYRFYVSDKKLKAGDVVTMNFYDKTKQIKKSVTITVVEPLKVTVADYKVGANYINATYNNPKITKIGLVVDGVKYWGGDVANGTVKYFAADKIKSATAVVTMNFYDANNNLLASRPVKVQPAAVGEVNTANFKVGTSNIKGTFSGDVKQIAISINGKKYYGGTVSSSDGSYKFYVLDKKITAADTVVVYGYDSSGKLLSQKDVTITE
ncbi:hypothetical protein PGRAN_15257, partial [Listeria grandensis FSL F6-0971]